MVRSIHPLSRQACKPKAGQVFTVSGDEYRLGGKIGDGAAGVVRKATRVSSQEIRAVKFLAPDPKYIDESVFEDVAARFRREGERAPSLEHPSLVPVYAYDQNKAGEAFSADGPSSPFIVMQFVKGKSLESFIRNLHPNERGMFLATKARLSIAIQVAEALDYLHRRNIVHRDVKPANIFLAQPGGFGTPIDTKLGDFGVVKWGDFHASVSTGTLTVSSQQGLGTLKYMAPEQAMAPKDVTVRSDVYSFGVTLFELFTGTILASPHHVFSIMTARMARGTTAGRYASLSVDIPSQFSELGGIILDMHLRGTTGRPAIRNVLGRLKWQFETLYGDG